jgi:hypothetical protein
LHARRKDTCTFPFRHTSLWADCDSSALRRYTEDFSKIVKLLAQSRLASVRNGLDHKRPESTFPSGDEMLACVARLRESFEVADLTRIYPKVFWLYSNRSYRAGTNEFEIRDYAGRTTLFFGPDLAIGVPTVQFDRPFLVCPGNLLGVPNAEICFRLADWNEYTKYWDGYPRRRRIPIADQRESSEEELDLMIGRRDDSGVENPESDITPEV